MRFAIEVVGVEIIVIVPVAAPLAVAEGVPKSLPLRAADLEKLDWSVREELAEAQAEVLRVEEGQPVREAI